jgi:hypothetical protein
MEKFGRSYRVTIDPKDGGPLIIITMPVTIQFTLQRNTMSSLNGINIDIYNLGKSNRDRLFQDRFVVRNRTIMVEAGYDTLSLIFSGNIFQASSAREGVNIITRIEALDGSFDVGTTNTFETLSKGKTLKDVMLFLAGQFPTLEIGAVGEYDEVLQRPVALNGNTYDLLKKYSSNQVFIDNGKVYVLKNRETVTGEIPKITPATGLLETPRRDDGFLTVTTLFEPRVAVGQQVELESRVLPVYNGQYKVLGILHQGIISEAVGGRCHSQFSLYVGNQTFSIAGP